MRKALTIQNGNAANEQREGGEFKNLGKLTRQIGHSDLRSDFRSGASALNINVESNFEVYEDPSPIKENTGIDNNVIHELERHTDAQAREIRGNFTQARAQNDPFADCEDGAPSSCGTINFDDEECDRLSAVSTNTTNSIRAGFSHFHVEKPVEQENNPYEDSDAMRQYALKKAEVERRNEAVVMCDEYYLDIYKYMFIRQSTIRASSRYMNKQADVSIEMRAILVDWFSDVILEYGLQQETFHLAVALVDRVLSKFCVEKQRLQLVGTTALMIAAKYEEIYPPELDQYSHITDNTFCKDQILMMERYLLCQLDYTVSSPTIAWFANGFARRQGANQQTRFTMKYLVDLCLMNYEFLKFLPSHLAAASLCFANVMNEQDPWPRSFERDFGITLSGFAVILPLLHKMFTDAPNGDCTSIFQKYSDSAYGMVAKLPPPAERYVVETQTMRIACPNLFEKRNDDLNMWE